MTQPVWEQLDPFAMNDGVYYVPAGVELQPRLPDWGQPDQPGLRERLANDRPHGVRGQKLVCLSACATEPRTGSVGRRSG